MVAQDIVKYYEGKLARKERMYTRTCAMLEVSDEVSDTVKKHVLEAEIRLLKEVLEDLR